MRAMVLHETGDASAPRLRAEEVAIPVPGPGKLLLRVRACAVCRTDLHIVEGDLPLHRRPLIPGHQIVGAVERIGHGATSHKIAERVGVAWLHHACGQCNHCVRDHENLCESARFTGYDVDGGFAQYVTVPADFAYRLPTTMTDEQAAPLLCAGIIGYRSLKMTGVQSGSRLGLFGFGASAHITIQLAVHQGMNVFVFTRGPSHRALAERLGANWSGPIDADPGVRLDGAIVFAPAGDVVPTAMARLDRGGTCALAGIHMTSIPALNYDKHLYYERRLVSVTANTRRDGLEFLQAAAAANVRTQVTLFPLEQANQALARLKAGQIDGAAVLTIE